MKIQIETTTNGYIVYEKQDEKVIKTIYRESDLQIMLYDVLSLIGPSESRYSQERIFIGTMPGDKYEGELSPAVKDTLSRISYLTGKELVDVIDEN